MYSGFRGGAYGVRIRHDGAGGKTYVTQYGHMVEQPPVKMGDQVDLGTIIGRVGRTGHAFLGGPHVHFTIRVMNTSEFDPFGGQAMKIPRLEVGSWVHSGTFIPGIYAGLSPIGWLSNRSFDVRVTSPGLIVYKSTHRLENEAITELPVGSAHTVLNTDRGQYEIEVAGQRGWIPHSGTMPVASTLFGVRVTASTSASVRRSPTVTSDNLIGVIPADQQRFLSAFERGGQTGDWVRVLWACNTTTNRSEDRDDDTRGARVGIAGIELDDQVITWPAAVDQRGCGTRVDPG